ncbi:MAG: prepilin-type N-terminal cleavage/methylation domain-containing protein [Phycisphaerae bacterium]|nr:prepilin-type N-terminal cleavage/methylation domain-containing protein [Phycisphaerae bacterium]
MNDSRVHPESRRAFTLVELLVVITIFVLLLAIAVPSFSSLIYSSERAQAENQLITGLNQARSAALATETSGDTAAVFFFDNGGRLRIVTCVDVGDITDKDGAGNDVTRDVFVPLSNYPAVQLPRGWAVRGFAPVGTTDNPTTNNLSGWYDSTATNRVLSSTTGNWVFPETAYYDPTKGDQGERRQTFMVRFQGGSGVLRGDVTTPAVVLDFSPATLFRNAMPWSEYRFDSTDRPEVLVRRAVGRSATDPSFKSASLPKLLGDKATDTVLTRCLTELALYDENELAGAIGARGLNKATNSIYGGPKINAAPTAPRIDQSLFGSAFDAAKLPVQINEWILGVGEQTKPSDVRMYTIDRYSGQAREVLP